MKAWVFGDNIDTDVIAPGRYMKFGIEKIAQHCLEAVNPDFSRQVTKGDIIVAANRVPIGSAAALTQAMRNHKQGTPLLLQVRRGETALFIALG